MKKIFLQTGAAILFFFVFFAGTNFTYSKILEQREYEVIKIAYMNGFCDVFKMEIKDINTIKKNQKLMKSMVFAAADSYIRKVEFLTAKEYAQEKSLQEAYRLKNDDKKIKYNYRVW